MASSPCEAGFGRAQQQHVNLRNEASIKKRPHQTHRYAVCQATLAFVKYRPDIIIPSEPTRTEQIVVPTNSHYHQQPSQSQSYKHRSPRICLTHCTNPAPAYHRIFPFLASSSTMISSIPYHPATLHLITRMIMSACTLLQRRSTHQATRIQ